MFTIEQEREPDEYTRLVWLLAVNDRMISDLTEQYDSGTDAPPSKYIESRYLSGEQGLVPAAVLAEYRTMLVQYSEKLRGDIQQFKRVRVNQHEFGSTTQAKSTTTKSPRRQGKKGRSTARSANG